MSRTNEELAVLIRGGAMEFIPELWEQIEGLVKWKARRIMAVLDVMPGRGVEFDDLVQSGYLALVEAVSTFDPDAGTFSGWFMYYLKKAFAAATGYRTKAGRMEPLNNALSLDTPLSDESDSDTLLAITEDPNGQVPLQRVEDRLWNEQLHNALELAMSTLPEQSAEILRLRHYDGLTWAAVGEIQGTTPGRIRQMEREAIRHMRKPSISSALRPFSDFDFYIGTGLGAFQHTGLTVQERYILVREECR